MLKGIAASQGIAIAKVYKLVQPVLDIQKKDANAEEELLKKKSRTIMSMQNMPQTQFPVTWLQCLKLWMMNT